MCGGCFALFTICHLPFTDYWVRGGYSSLFTIYHLPFTDYWVRGGYSSLFTIYHLPFTDYWVRGGYSSLFTIYHLLFTGWVWVLMTLRSSPAFVLAVYPYKERNAVVVLCTEGEGIKRAAVKGVKGRRSKFGAVLTTLSEITAHFFEHEKGELIALTDADLIKSAIPLVLNLPCPAILDHLAEMTMEFVQENEANPSMYRLLRTALDALEAGLPWQQVKTYFDFWVLKFNGTLPDFSRCRCGQPAKYWDHDALKPRCAAHAAGNIPYAGGLPELASAIRTRKPVETPLFEPNREAYRLLHALLGELRTRFLSKPLKSSALLGECDKLFVV